MKRITGLLLLSILLFFVSCKKDSGGTTPTDIQAVIDISKPSPGLTYINGTMLPIEGLMIDDNGLSSAKVEIRNKSNNIVLFQQTTTTGNVNFYNFNWNWTVTGISGTITAAVKVTARDKLGNEFSKEVDITLSN